MNGGYSMIDTETMNRERVAILYTQGKPVIVYTGDVAEPACISKQGGKYTITTPTTVYEVSETGITKKNADFQSMNYSAETGVKNIFNYDAWKTVVVNNGNAVASENSYAMTSTYNNCFTSYAIEATYPYPEGAKMYTVPGNKYIFSWKASGLTEGKTYRITIFKNGVTSVLADTLPINATEGFLEFTAPADCTFVTFYVALPTAGTSVTFSNFMCRNAGISDSSYAPYVPTNAELYAMVQALTPTQNTQETKATKTKTKTETE